MKVATVKGQTRAIANRHALKNLRKQGLLPAVIYGHGQDPEYVAIDQHDLVLALEHGQHVISLEVNGDSKQYLLKDVQYDHLVKNPLHVDLMRVDPNERVIVTVSLEFKGTPKGLQAGGTFVTPLTDLEIECRLLDIPESIRVNVENLEFNQTIYVRDLVLPEGVTAETEPNVAVATVSPKRGEEEVAVAEAAEGAAAQPEVIKRRKEEDEQAED